MATIALFGGSFNPPHVAHQMLCLWVLETQDVDGVLVVPTWRHAFDKGLAPYEDRVAMCKLAMAPLGARVAVSTIEGELAAEPSRTFVTLEALAKKDPAVRYRVVIGADILPEREKWYRWPDIERLAPPIVVGRAGHASEAAVDIPAVSSTEIRARLAAGRSVTGLVPRPVLQYITEKGLYRPERAKQHDP